MHKTARTGTSDRAKTRRSRRSRGRRLSPRRSTRTTTSRAQETPSQDRRHPGNGACPKERYLAQDKRSQARSRMPARRHRRSRTPSHRQRRTGETWKRTSRSKASYIVHDVTDEKAPPDDERQDQGQSSACPEVLIGKRLPPAQPICRQNAQTNGN